MTLRIELPPDVEAKYAAEACAKGVPLERYVRDRLIAQAPAPLDMTPQERARALKEWAKSNTVHLTTFLWYPDFGEEQENRKWHARLQNFPRVPGLPTTSALG